MASAPGGAAAPTAASVNIARRAALAADVATRAAAVAAAAAAPAEARKATAAAQAAAQAAAADVRERRAALPNHRGALIITDPADDLAYGRIDLVVKAMSLDVPILHVGSDLRVVAAVFSVWRACCNITMEECDAISVEHSVPIDSVRKLALMFRGQWAERRQYAVVQSGFGVLLDDPNSDFVRQVFVLSGLPPFSGGANTACTQLIAADQLHLLYWSTKPTRRGQKGRMVLVSWLPVSEKARDRLKDHLQGLKCISLDLYNRLMADVVLTNRFRSDFLLFLCGALAAVAPHFYSKSPLEIFFAREVYSLKIGIGTKTGKCGSELGELAELMTDTATINKIRAVSKICEECGITPLTERCGHCGSLLYCSTHCKHTHWENTHNKTCKVYIKKNRSLGSVVGAPGGM